MQNTYKIATGTVTRTATGLVHKSSNAYSGKIAAKEASQKPAKQ